MTWASAAARTASLPAFAAMGRDELALDDLLREVKLDANATYDHVLDSLWRCVWVWGVWGGGGSVGAGTACEGGWV